MILNETQAEQLKEWMEREELTNAELAKRLRCSESLISRVISRERPIGAGYRVRFARAFSLKTYLDIFGEPEVTPEVELYQLKEVPIE